MYMSNVYEYRANGIICVGANPPEGAEILKTMDILNSEEGYELIRKSDRENFGNSLWLKDGDVMKNYEEVEEVHEDIGVNP